MKKNYTNTTYLETEFQVNLRNTILSFVSDESWNTTMLSGAISNMEVTEEAKETEEALDRVQKTGM